MGIANPAPILLDIEKQLEKKTIKNRLMYHAEIDKIRNFKSLNFDPIFTLNTYFEYKK